MSRKRLTFSWCEDNKRIVQAHVPGDLVKFYAVKGGFFKYFYPSDDGESKFGDENLMVMHVIMLSMKDF